jgi:hypothetical protein
MVSSAAFANGSKQNAPYAPVASGASRSNARQRRRRFRAAVISGRPLAIAGSHR